MDRTVVLRIGIPPGGIPHFHHITITIKDTFFPENEIIVNLKMWDTAGWYPFQVINVMIFSIVHTKTLNFGRPSSPDFGWQKLT